MFRRCNVRLYHFCSLFGFLLLVCDPFVVVVSVQMINAVWMIANVQRVSEFFVIARITIVGSDNGAVIHSPIRITPNRAVPAIVNIPAIMVIVRTIPPRILVTVFSANCSSDFPGWNPRHDLKLTSFFHGESSVLNKWGILKMCHVNQSMFCQIVRSVCVALIVISLSIFFSACYFFADFIIRHNDVFVCVFW